MTKVMCRLLSIAVLTGTAGLAAPAFADAQPNFAQHNIVFNDSRIAPAYFMRASFTINGDRHVSNVSTPLDSRLGRTLKVTGSGGTWSSARSTWEGNFLTLKGTGSARPGEILIEQWDTRTMGNLCFEIWFTTNPNGEWHYDYECVGNSVWSFTRSFLNVNGQGGTSQAPPNSFTLQSDSFYNFGPVSWRGDFLRPSGH